MDKKIIINNSRIAKNTILLYIRQIIIIVVSLYTSRIVLNTLGEEDFGIYNVVGGIVIMFSFLSSTMASASQRYLSVDLAKDNKLRLKETFSLIALSYVVIAIFVFVLCETIALWFLNTKMNIPSVRIVAANWVLQCSFLAFLTNILSTPYLSVIIAREKMDIYAYVSLIDAILKLLIVFILPLTKEDKLILYAILIFISTLISSCCYVLYCIYNFEESRYMFFYDKNRLKDMFSFAWWNIIGAISNVLRSEGINVLLNVFFNPIVNAARGIAFSVNAALTNFTNSFYTAVRPQIIKRYSAGAVVQMFELIFMSSKFAYYLLFVLALPILFETEGILFLWLKKPPVGSALFVRLIIVNALLEVLNYPLVNALQATGRIKTYQIIVSGCYLLNLPISYILLKNGYGPEFTMYTSIFLLMACFIPRLVICKKEFRLSIFEYLKKVILKIILVTFGGGLIGFGITRKIFIGEGIEMLVTRCLLLMTFTIFVIYFFGIAPGEKKTINKIILTKIKKYD